jgi:3-methyladenine DNA glycosylase Tag
MGLLMSAPPHRVFSLVKVVETPRIRADSATTRESDQFSRGLERREFSLVGSTVIYGQMQAVGMVNDHLLDCFRYRDVRRLGTSSE